MGLHARQSDRERLTVMAEPSSMERVELAAAALGLPIRVQVMAQSTRTAEEAAAAVGCEVAQIVKSLIFENTETQGLVLLLLSGQHNADTAHLAAAYGLRLKRADIDRVRKDTGFAIGGVAPFGHLTALPVCLDRTLLAFDTVWCAAGRPDAVFACSPQALAEATQARVLDMRA